MAASAARFAQAARSSQILFLPGGFSGGDEPDGSGKFITAFLRSPQAADCTRCMDLLKTGITASSWASATASRPSSSWGWSPSEKSGTQMPPRSD